MEIVTLRPFKAVNPNTYKLETKFITYGVGQYWWKAGSHHFELQHGLVMYCASKEKKWISK